MIRTKAYSMLEQVAYLYSKFHQHTIRWLLSQYGIDDKYINEMVRLTDKEEKAMAEIDRQATLLEKRWASLPPPPPIEERPVITEAGYIYFIFNKSISAIKIGYSLRPKERLASLQTSNPVELRLVAVVKGDMVDERNYHARFQTYRLKGEWFTLHDELRELINHLRKQERLAKKRASKKGNGHHG